MDNTKQSYLSGTKHVLYKLRRGTKTSSRRTNDIEVLSEQLGSLQITEEASSKYKRTTTEKMLVAPTLAAVANSKNVQAGMPKNMVPDLGWFDGD